MTGLSALLVFARRSSSSNSQEGVYYLGLLSAQLIINIHLRYAEVLENTQFALIATVHKLYNMVRSGEQWSLGEPELNDRGLPVIHDIASKLGAIRPNSDIDLPVHSVFPEDEAGMAELARQLEEQQLPGHDTPTMMSRKDSDSATSSSMSPDMDHSDDGELDMNYRRMAFGNINTGMSSPASLTHSADLDTTPTSDVDINNYNLFASQPVATGTFTPPMWPEMMTQQPLEQQALNPAQQARLQQLQQQQEQMRQLAAYSRVQMMQQQGQGNNFAMKPTALSHPDSDPMISMGDPMIYHGFDINDRGVYDL